MAIDSICSCCLRALRQQSRFYKQELITLRSLRIRRYQQPFLQRSFTSTTQRPSQTQPPSSRKPELPPSSSAPKPPPAPTFQNLASTLRSSPALRSATEPYVAYGSTEDLFRQCSAQCTYTIPSALLHPPGQPPQNGAGDHLGEGSGWWLEPRSKGGLGLEVTFNSWAQVLFLHMWLLTVRLRCFPEKYVKDWHQNLLDHFFYAAEDRMATWHGMSARGVRNKNLKDLWMQWRGAQLGYDEGLVRGDAVLATAVWRNLFKANEGVDIQDVAVVTAYIFRELKALGQLDDVTITEGKVQFGDPRGLTQVMSRESPAMRLRLTAEELEAPDKIAKET